MPLADDVDLARLAATTPAMVGADLANVVNAAALTAARRNHDAVTMADLHDALEKLVLGTERLITENGHLPIPGASDISPVTQQLVDEEVRHLIEDAHEQVTRLMSANRDKLDALAQALLKHETLEEDEAYAAAGIAQASQPTAAERERRSGESREG